MEGRRFFDVSKFLIYTKAILIPVVVGLLVEAITSSLIEYNTIVKLVLSSPSILLQSFS